MRCWLLSTVIVIASCYNPASPSGDGTEATTTEASTNENPTTTTATTQSTTGATTQSSTEPSTTSSDPDSGETTNAPTTDEPTTDPSDPDSGETSRGESSSSGEPAESSSTDPGPVACTPVGRDCDDDEYCDAPDCVTQGVCVTSPLATSGTMAPACGCDDTSYWNVDHAHWLGATAFSSGDAEGCGAAATSCSDDGDCSTAGAECVIEHGLGAASCNNAQMGRCWAIPGNADCSVTPALPEVGFGSCASGPNTCTVAALDYCEALVDGDFFAICI